MKVFRILILACLVTTNVKGQDIITATDSVFKEYMKTLKNNGNDFYTLCNRLGVKQVVDDYKHALERRRAVGKLSPSDEAFLKIDLWKLEGDYYYLQTDYDNNTDNRTWSFKKAEESFRNYLEACEAWDSHPGREGECFAHRELAQLYYKQERYQEAANEMEMALKAITNFSKDEDEQYDVLSQYAMCLARTGNYEMALEVIDEVLENYEGTETAHYGEALRKKAKILMLREENGGEYSRAEALQCYRNYFDLKKKDALNRFMEMSSSERKQYWMYVRPFVVDCYRLEDADAGFLYDVTLFAKGLLLQLESAGGGKQNIHATWQMVQEKLKPDACAIEFVQYEKYGLQQMGAIVLKKTGSPMFVKMAPPDSVMQYKIDDKSVEERIHHIAGANFDNRKIRNAVYNDTTGLFSLIWMKDLVQMIEDTNDVWFAPDGYMHRLAIEYLLPETIRHLRCHRLTSTRRLLEQPPSLSDASAMIVGGINYNAPIITREQDNDEQAFNYVRNDDDRTVYSFADLTNSLRAVKDLYRMRCNPQDSLITDSIATEQCFRKICGNYPVVHISSHGVFTSATVPQGTDIKPNLCDSTLSQSLIALAGININLTDKDFDPTVLDGILSAKEISALDMSKTELAILCCCETGLGQITSDGVYGLQRGLKNAGVKAMVCTLWDIYENSSNLFMAVFHYHLRQGKSIYESFQYAREAMIDYEDGNVLDTEGDIIRDMTKDINDNYNEPSYRDAFVLIDALE